MITPKSGYLIQKYQNEDHYNGRFFFTVVDNHLKVIDTQEFRLFDLLTEQKFDQEAMNAVGMTRSMKDRTSRFLLLCNSGDQSYV